ncbi:hypothetical protein TI05_12565, partial [Achromatium sp. WMS3]
LGYELQHGAKFVIYQYCISIIVATFKRPSNIYFFKADKSSFQTGLKFSLISFLLGWWCIPWGPIYTIKAIAINLKGGQDVTQEIINSLQNLKNVQTTTKFHL